MDFESYIDTIARSAPADWNVEEDPLFFHPASITMGPEAATASLFTAAAEPSAGPLPAVHFIMAYRRDLSITMAYGMPSRVPLRSDFAARFPDPRASMKRLDFFYNASLVFREVFISVDGEQGILPVPNPGPTAPYEAPRRKCAVARLIHQLTNPMRDFDDYLTYVNLKAIDEFWPL